MMNSIDQQPLKPGQRVTWYQDEGDGSGFVMPIAGVVVKPNQETVTIRVARQINGRWIAVEQEADPLQLLHRRFLSAQEDLLE